LRHWVHFASALEGVNNLRSKLFTDNRSGYSNGLEVSRLKRGILSVSVLAQTCSYLPPKNAVK
jgi:hypothetical protein